MSTNQWIQLLMFLVLFGGPAIGWVFKALQQQAQEKRRRDERSRRVNDAFRTGQAMPLDEVVTESPARPLTHTEARARLQELAERRKAQLEELRRRQAQGGSQPAPGRTAAPQPAPVILTQPPQRPRVPTSRPTVSPPVAVPHRGPRPAARSPQPMQRTDRRPAQPVGTQPSRQVPIEPTTPHEGVHRHVPDMTAYDITATPVLTAPIMRDLTRTDWRRAVLMAELLGKPVSLRHGLTPVEQPFPI